MYCHLSKYGPPNSVYTALPRLRSSPGRYGSGSGPLESQRVDWRWERGRNPRPLRAGQAGEGRRHNYTKGRWQQSVFTANRLLDASHSIANSQQCTYCTGRMTLSLSNHIIITPRSHTHQPSKIKKKNPSPKV